MFAKYQKSVISQSSTVRDAYTAAVPAGGRGVQPLHPRPARRHQEVHPIQASRQEARHRRHSDNPGHHGKTELVFLRYFDKSEGALF